MLLFKKKFLDAIRRGEKTQTIRLWKARRMRSGQQSYIPGVGYIDITAVDEVSLDALTDADAIPDGFPSAAALRTEIRDLYPKELKAGYKAYRLVFTVVSDGEQAKRRDRKRSRRRESGVGGRESGA